MKGTQTWGKGHYLEGTGTAKGPHEEGLGEPKEARVPW